MTLGKFFAKNGMNGPSFGVMTVLPERSATPEGAGFGARTKSAPPVVTNAVVKSYFCEPIGIGAIASVVPFDSVSVNCAGDSGTKTRSIFSRAAAARRMSATKPVVFPSCTYAKGASRGCATRTVSATAPSAGSQRIASNGPIARTFISQFSPITARIAIGALLCLGARARAAICS